MGVDFDGSLIRPIKFTCILYSFVDPKVRGRGDESTALSGKGPGGTSSLPPGCQGWFSAVQLKKKTTPNVVVIHLARVRSGWWGSFFSMSGFKGRGNLLIHAHCAGVQHSACSLKCKSCFNRIPELRTETLETLSRIGLPFPCKPFNFRTFFVLLEVM